MYKIVLLRHGESDWNMENRLPELDLGFAYPAFWFLSASAAGAMLLFFRRKGWL